MRRIITTAITALAAVTLTASPAWAQEYRPTYYVDPYHVCTFGAETHFHDLQEGIDAVNSGDTLIVCAGVYEGVTVTKSDVEIVVDPWAWPGDVLIDGDAPYGFKLQGVQDVRIEGFYVSSFDIGIWADAASANNVITNNNVYGSAQYDCADDSSGANQWLSVTGATQNRDGLCTPSSDTTPPTIIAVGPGDGAVDVPLQIAVEVDFDEAMQTAATEGAFSLVRASDGAPVAGSFYWMGAGWLRFWSPDLEYDTQYRARVTTAAKDAAGNALAAERTWTFTTADTTPPSVASISPANGSTGVSRSTNVYVYFSEAMNQASAQGAFSLVRASDGAAVSGSFSWSGNTLVFRPAVLLARSTQYRVRVTTAARDLAGNALAAEASSTFTTAKR